MAAHRSLILSAGMAAVVAAAMVAHSAEDPKPGRKSTAAMPVIRANQIAGMVVKDPAGKDLGKVEDVVVDMETGKVRYAAIAFGGFLGLGDKLFAVPFHSLKLHHNPGDKTQHFELNVDKKALENAPGFDPKNWPDFADPKYGESNDRFYKVPAAKPTSAK